MIHKKTCVLLCREQVKTNVVEARRRAIVEENKEAL